MPKDSCDKVKRVVLLGSTGSIGESALRVARDIPHRMRIVGLAAGRNGRRLVQQAAACNVKELALADEEAAQVSRQDLPEGSVLHDGAQGLIELATLPEADLVIIAIVGTAGLRPALAAIEAGKDIAVASKEILVLAGEQVMEAAARKGVHVLPIDSEHNAIFQCLDGRETDAVRRLILTASGGPFRTTPAAELAHVTPAQALKHPTWAMGRKISIDSATLFNKGLEMIEARWLFNIEMGRVEVVIHPQSIVHSMVEFVDGSVLAQLSHSDMCFPIQYAVTWPERLANSLRPLDFAALGSIDFEAPRRSDFPALDLARRAGEVGGTLSAVLNAANEVAVDAFLDGRITFPDIWRTVAVAMEAHQITPHPTLEELLDADQWARREAGRICGASTVA